MLTENVNGTVADDQINSPVKQHASFSTSARTQRKYEVGETFNIDLGPEEDDQGPVLDAAGKPVKKKREVTGYVDRTEWVPKIDPTYVFPNKETRIVLLGLESKDRVLLVGPT